MKANSTQLEILILTGTTFSANQFSDKNEATGKPGRTEKEMLTEACWNGILGELLPGVIEKSSSGKNLFLWQIRHGASILEIELGEFPQSFVKEYSIDPYYIFEALVFN